MTFALCPDDGPPRLWRFIDDDTMTEAKLVALLDARQNLLFVNKPLFDKLGELEQHVVLRTHARCTYF